MMLTTVCCYQVMSEVLLDGSMFTRSPALVQMIFPPMDSNLSKDPLTEPGFSMHPLALVHASAGKAGSFESRDYTCSGIDGRLACARGGRLE